MTGSTVTLRVARGAPGEPSRIESHEVPYREGMSVLDAVMWIRGHVDSSLAIRYSCINANACKECMVRVDGKVLVTELSGSESVVHFELGGGIWISQSHGIHPFNAGDQASFYVDTVRCMYFAQDSGRRAA